jgi:hypothetical protein
VFPSSIFYMILNGRRFTLTEVIIAYYTLRSPYISKLGDQRSERGTSMKVQFLLRLSSLCILLLLSMNTNGFAACLVPVSLNTTGTTTSFPATEGSSSFTISTGANGAGTSCIWTLFPTPPSFISVSPAGGGGGSTFVFNETFTVFANPNLAARVGTITVQQQDSTTASFTITQAAVGGGFTVSLSPSSQTVTAGNSTTYTVMIGRTAPFAGAVSLFPIGLPTGANGTFSPNPTTGTSSTLTVTTAANATVAGTYSFFVRGVNGAVTHNTTTASLIVNPAPTPTPTPTPSPTPAPAFPGSGSSELSSFLDVTGISTGAPGGQAIFYRATDQAVHRIYSNTTWLTDNPTSITGAPAAVSSSSITSFLDLTGITTGAPGGQAIFYIAADQHVHHLFYNGTWHTDDPSAGAGAPLAETGSPLTSFLDATGKTTGGFPGQAIFYIGTDQHVHHLFTDTTWHADDPTAGADAPLAATNSSLCSFLDVGGKTTGGIPGQAIFYIGTDQHVHHLYSNTTWFTDDPTAITGATLAASGSSLVCFLDPTGKLTGGTPGQAVFYIGTDQHIHHLFSDISWHTDDPTAGSGAPLAATGSTLTGFFDPTGATNGGIPGQALFFLGTDQHVHHVFSDTTWRNDDPTAGSGAPLAAVGSPLSSFVDATGKTTGGIPGQAIFFIGTDQHVHHLFSDTTWHNDDPTAGSGATLATF